MKYEKYQEMVERFPVGSRARVKRSGREFIVQGHSAGGRWQDDPWVQEGDGEYWSAWQIEPVGDA